MPANNALVEKAQLDEQFKQSNIVCMGHVVIGALISFFYWSMVDHTLLTTWFSILALVQIVRYLLSVKYKQIEYTTASGKLWLNIFTLGIFLTGICWGVLASTLVTHCKSDDLVILFLALAFLVAGNIATSSYRKRLFVAFSTPTLVPAGILGFFGDQVSMTLGAYSIALWLLSWIAVRRLNESLVNALTLGFKNQDLVKELEKEKIQLEKTNERLSRELQQKLSMTKWLATGNWQAESPDSYPKADISNGNFSETLMDTWEVAIEEQKPLSMVMFQVDNMDPSNKPDGDEQDKGLTELQRLICSEIRSQDQYLKINNMEFALILANMPSTDATSMVNRIRNKIASLPTPLSLDNGTPITLSFGVAGWVPDVTQNSSELVSVCRKAKNLSVEQGGNQVNIG